MPTIKNTTFNGNSADILNAIRNGASSQYRDYVAVADGSNYKEIGATLERYPLLQNEFLTALVNRIALVVMQQKSMENPLARLKKGLLEYGETIEEIFVELAKPFQFDPATAESEIFKREIPDVRAAFHIMNYQKFYKQTISADQLQQAFLSNEGVLDLINKIVNAMYASAIYDEFIAMKYLTAISILDGKLYPVSVPEVTAANAKAITTKLKGVSNAFEFATPKYNYMGVHNHASKEDQVLIINSSFDAEMSVNVLASAFNISEAEFLGKTRILIDSFGNLDMARLTELLGDNPGFREISEAELAALDAIPAILIDRNWFMIFDNKLAFREAENGQGLYWNYWLHSWKTLSVSPFSNAAVFVPGTPAIETVTVTPSTATVDAGQSVQLTAEVVTDAFADKRVSWSISPSAGTVTQDGLVTLKSTATGTVTVTATSVVDSTKSASCTITIPSGVRSVTVAPSTASIAAGATTTLTATVDAFGGAADTVAWTSSDDTKASVSDAGVVTGEAEGSATITATSTADGTKTGTCTVTVTAAPNANTRTTTKK